MVAGSRTVKQHIHTVLNACTVEAEDGSRSVDATPRSNGQLAAARATTLPPEEALARLHDRFAALRSGAHRRLDDAIGRASDSAP